MLRDSPAYSGLRLCGGSGVRNRQLWADGHGIVPLAEFSRLTCAAGSSAHSCACLWAAVLFRDPGAGPSFFGALVMLTGKPAPDNEPLRDRSQPYAAPNLDAQVLNVA